VKEHSQTNQILQLAEDNKMLRINEVTAQGLSRSSFYNLVKSGKLVNIGRGLYTLPNTEFSEHQTLLETAKSIPNSVLCLLSALRFYDLTTQNPFEIWIAIERKSRLPQTATLPVRVMFFTDKAFTEGIETHEIEGVKVQVYNPAKTVADCFKYRNKIGIDVALEALRDTWRQKKATMDELWHYAKICRMTNVMRPYLESLV
jgi:predicted transcriptional regulator of viral defense system